MVLSEDEVPDGEVLWRAFKCSHPTSTSFAPLSPSLLFHSRSTSNLNHRGISKKVHRFLRVRESLNLHDCDIYRGYALIRQELPSTYPVSHPWTASSRPILLILIWRSSSLWTSVFTMPSAFGGLLPTFAVFFCFEEKFLQGTRPAVFHREIMARSLALAHGCFIASLLSRSLILWNV